MDRFHRLVHEDEWVRGAVNYDEDLHFSSFYLRASCAPHTGSLYPGYHSLVAFYQGFNEEYYLRKRECLTVAQAIVTKALRQPAWLPQVLGAIERHSDLLGRVFSPRTTGATLARLSDREILALYRRHAVRHRILYRYARLPEALDRGVTYFSTYLQNYLGQRGLDEAARVEAFAVLSQPVVPSVLSEELLEFDSIVRRAPPQTAAQTRLLGGGPRARMFLDPDLIERLDQHREKWRFLHYHGYGRRDLPGLGHYVERLLEQLNGPSGSGQLTKPSETWNEAKQARQKLLPKLRMDRAHRTLFEIYPAIGAAKLYRRFAQLRNFYYLDLLLGEMARRLDVSEWTIRCMLPEELTAVFQAKGRIEPAILRRLSGCMFALLNGEEHVMSGSEATKLLQLFQNATCRRPSGNVLRGVVASRGKVSGPCRVMVRADDQRAGFAKGSILVSEATDPDLIGCLRIAGGVLTEQGGVTSHAAIICRELGIPAVIGIDGLLATVRDGDMVEVDADHGTVTLVKDRRKLPRGAVAGAGQERSVDQIGAKAYNLGVARALGFTVPEFIVLNYEDVRRAIGQRSASACQQLVQWTQQQLGLTPDEQVAVRSSAHGEDRESGSLAGEYQSLLRVAPDRIAKALRDFVRLNQVGQTGTIYRGSIIVQRMIHADCGGVCLTLDRRAGRGDALILEMAVGGNESITTGLATPERIVMDRLTGDILESERRGGQQPSAAFDLGHIMQQFLTLETRFGKAVDIEWAWSDRQLYVLQVRPIVGDAGDARTL